MLRHTRGGGRIQKIAVCHCRVSSANVCNRPRGYCSHSSGTRAESSVTLRQPEYGGVSPGSRMA